MASAGEGLLLPLQQVVVLRRSVLADGLLEVLQQQLDHEGELATGHQVLQPVVLGPEEAGPEHHRQVVGIHLVVLLVGHHSSGQKCHCVAQHVAGHLAHPAQTFAQEVDVVLGLPVRPVGHDHVVDLVGEEGRVEIVEYLLQAA